MPNLKSFIDNKIFALSFMLLMQTMFIQNIKVYFCFWFLVLLNEKKFKSFYSKILFVVHLIFTYFYVVFNYLSKDELPIFWDLQSFLQLINCNYDFNYEFVFLNTTKLVSCINDMGFGPLSFYIGGKLNTQLITILFAVFYLFFLFFLLYKKFKTNELVKMTLLLISPSFLFLFESLNPDIFIFIYFSYRLIIRRDNLSFNIVDLVILTFFTQIKIYTLAVLFGILAYQYLKKERISLTFFFVFLNILFLTYHYFVLDKGTPTPSAINRTFGIISDFYIFKNSFGINYFIIFLFICSVLIFINRKDVNQFIDFSNPEYLNYVTITYSPMIILILAFGNYGYKYTFVILFFIALSFNLTLRTKITIYFSFLSTPLLYLFGYNYNDSIYNFLFYVFNRISLLYILFILISMLINSIKYCIKTHIKNAE